MDDNTQLYDVTLRLVEPLELEATSLSTTIAGAQLSVDNQAATIMISALTNFCAVPPCREAGDNIGTLTVTAVPGKFTLENGAANMDFLIPDQPGAASMAVTIGDIVLVSTTSDDPIEYVLVADYTGVQVSELVNAVANIAELINPVFNDQILSTTLSDNNTTITLSGTNTISGTGNIGAGNKLPAGYEIIQPDGSPYTFNDPDADSIAASSALLPELSIRELGVDGNVQTYTVMLELAELIPRRLEVSHITLEGSDVLPEIDHLQRLIVVKGFTNSCTILPCEARETQGAGTIRIANNSGTFTIQSVTAPDPDVHFISNNNEGRFSVPDQAGAASVIFDLGMFTITRTDDAVVVEYSVKVYYNGIPVTEIINQLGDITELVTADFAGKSATTTLENNILVVNGLPNLPGETGTGNVELTSPLFPNGYSVTPYSFTNPAGTDAVTLTGMLVFMDELSVINDNIAVNQITYTLNVRLHTPVYTLQETTDCYRNDIDAEILVTEFYEDKTANEFVLELYVANLGGSDFIQICQLGLRSYARVLQTTDVSVDWYETDFQFPLVDTKLYNGNFYIIRFAAAGTGTTSSEVIELSYESETLPVLPASYDNCVLLELYYQQFDEASGETELLKTLDFVQLGEGCGAVAAAPVYSTTGYAQASPQLSLPGSDNSLSRKLETSGSARFQTALNSVSPIFSGDDWLQEGRNLLLPTDAHCVTLNDSDADGDGVFDCLEDEASDTYFGMALYDWGARTDQVDLFWEIDYMACAYSQDYRTEPARASLDKLKTIIDGYFVNGVPLKLHLDVGDLFDNNPDTTNAANYDLGGGNNFLKDRQSLSNYYGISFAYGGDKYYETKASNFSQGRKQFFYYMLLAQTIASDGGPSDPLGQAELFGNDIIIALGGFDEASLSPFDRSQYYACSKRDSSIVHKNYYQNLLLYVMMHEIGHNLKLHHGGDLDNSTNYKPNYFSAMNFLYQEDGVPIPSNSIAKAMSRFTNNYFLKKECIADGKYLFDSNDPENLLAYEFTNRQNGDIIYPDVYNAPIAAYDVAFSTGEQDSIAESSVSEIFYIDGDTDNPVNIDYNCNGVTEAISYEEDINFDEKISTISDNNDLNSISFFFGGNSQNNNLLRTGTLAMQGGNVYSASALEESMKNGELTLNRAQSITSRTPIKPWQRVFSDRQPIIDESY